MVLKIPNLTKLGNIIFEMVTGLPPFYTQDRNELFEKIKFLRVKYPPYISGSLRSLLKGLLKKDPKKRLGFNGPDEVMTHEWFREVDWSAMFAKEYSPFFVPVLNDGHDVSNFDTDFTEMEIDSLSMGSSTNRKYSDFDGIISKVTFRIFVQFREE